MSFKKRFLKRIEEDKKSMYTESDRAFLLQLQDMVVERPEGGVKVKRFNYKALIASVACFLVALLTVSLILFYLLQPKGNEVFYLEDNIVYSELTIGELNEELTQFTLEADENKYIVDIKKMYDSVSSDTLYYAIDIKNAISDFSLLMHLDIVVNEKYNYPPKSYGDEAVEKNISNYTIKYLQTSTYTPIGDWDFYTVNCKGEMKVGKQWIYITTYQEVSATEEGTFLETLQSIIHFN